MTNLPPVLCKNCKHYKSYRCKHPSNIELVIDYHNYYTVEKECAQSRNGNNDCRLFEYSLWYSIKKILRITKWLGGKKN